MKLPVRWTWGLGLLIVALAVGQHYAQEAPRQPTNSPPPSWQTEAAAAPVPAPATPGATAPPPAGADAAEAAFQPMSNAKPLPPAVSLTAPAAEVIRLAQSGVDEGVMLAFVTNSSSTFNLSPDAIIYLNDIGVPGGVVAAMIQRDGVLKESPVSDVNTAAPAPAPVSTPDQFAPVLEGAGPDLAPPPTAPPAEEMASGAQAPLDYGPADSGQPAPDESAYAPFYDALAPYGTWVDVAGYGPCWQPTLVIGSPYWQPYCDGGRWIYSDSGWYWSSTYSWGWAPFHYGRWFRHQRLGWCWAPGRTWGPAWVCWRYGTAFCAWAPLPPGAQYKAGVGLTFKGAPVANTFTFGLSAQSFAVVPFNHFWDRQPARYALRREQTRQALAQTAASTSFIISNNRIMNLGLPPSRVIASTGLGIRPVALHEPFLPGQVVHAERLDYNSRTLSALRPNARPANASTSAFANSRNSNPPRSNGSQAAVSALAPAGRAAPQAGANYSRSQAELYQRLQSQQAAAAGWERRSMASSRVPPAPPVEQQFAVRSFPPPQPPPTAPAASYAPPRVYTPPAPSYTPPPQVLESRPAYTAPPAPSAGSHAAQQKFGR
jgi:Family of unknown function (DUF6600)